MPEARTEGRKPTKIDVAGQHVVGAERFGARRARALIQKRRRPHAEFGSIFVSTAGGAALGSLLGPMGAFFGGIAGVAISAINEGIVTVGRKR